MKKMSIEQINVNGVMTPQAVVPIIGDGACLFRSLSFLIYHTQERYAEIRERIVKFAAENWNEFAVFSHDANGDNFISSEKYVYEMSQHSAYAGYCELVAAAKIFPYLFEVYNNKELYAKFGIEACPVKRLRLTGFVNSGHFDVYMPISEV